jgi:hypothetical protein
MLIKSLCYFHCSSKLASLIPLILLKKGTYEKSKSHNSVVVLFPHSSTFDQNGCGVRGTAFGGRPLQNSNLVGRRLAQRLLEQQRQLGWRWNSR